MVTYDEDESDATAENGTTTTLLGAHDDGTVTLFGTKAMLDDGNDTTAVDGIEKTTESGTVDGTLVKSTMAIELITTTWLNGNEVTNDNETATGEFHDDGTVTDDGTETNELTGTETTTDVGTDWITDDETQLGTLVVKIITADGDVAIVI